MRILLVFGIAFLSVWFVKNLMWFHRKGGVSAWKELAVYLVAGAAFGSAILFRNELRSVSIWLSAMCFWIPLLVMMWRFIRLTGNAEYQALVEAGGLAKGDLEPGS